MTTAPQFIAFEGGEGSGKSTQAARLAKALNAHLTREPGGTRIGAVLRSVLLDPDHTELADRTEALLYAADRAQHVAEVVRPALAAGQHVVSDRSAWSSVVYQGYGREMGPDVVRQLCDWAMQGCWPDVVVLLDVDPTLGLARLARLDRTLDRLELAGDGFHDRVRRGFLELAAAHADRWIRIDASRPPDEVGVDVLRAVAERLAP
jgi:dTMP kinase